MAVAVNNNFFIMPSLFSSLVGVAQFGRKTKNCTLAAWPGVWKEPKRLPKRYCAAAPCAPFVESYPAAIYEIDCFRLRIWERPRECLAGGAFLLDLPPIIPPQGA